MAYFYGYRSGTKLNREPKTCMTVPPRPNARKNDTAHTAFVIRHTVYGHETLAAAAATSLVRLPYNSDCCVLYEFGIWLARRRNTSPICASAAAHPKQNERS